MTQMKPHKGTLFWAVVIGAGLIVLYHFGHKH